MPKPQYYLVVSASGWYLVHKDEDARITPVADEESTRRAARFAGCDISHGQIWNIDRQKWGR